MRRFEPGRFSSGPGKEAVTDTRAKRSLQGGKIDEVWAGADPGGDGAFGVAVIRESGSTSCSTVSSVGEAVNWITAKGTPLGVGIDSPMWWSAGRGGGRLADKRLRTAYGIPSGTVQSVNSLRGAALAGGLLLASLLRGKFPDVKVTESHPKALLIARSLNPADAGAVAAHFGIEKTWCDDHQRDAAIAAVCARNGFRGKWRVDLADQRCSLEQDPKGYWLAPVHYWWPDAIE